MITISIRYCGGCNPDYDRTRLASRIQAALERICRFVIGEDAFSADRILVIHGCPTACADVDPALSERTVHIRSSRDAAAFIRTIRDTAEPD